MKGKQPGTAAVPIHETFRIAALLAVVGGFLDAYTYILRGGVFANAQTGNMVLLGVYAAQGRYRQAGYCIIPILAFALGVFITEVFKKYFTEKEFNIYEHWIIAIEIILLSVVGFVPASVPDSVVNVTISFVCSLQVNSFRKMKNLPYASTMCTGNLRSGTEKLFQYVINKETKAGIQAAHYFGIILLFILGAVAGTVLAFLWGIQSIWCCSILLGVVFVTMCLTIR
ncbi:YoaK family protein [[Clostridium] hylemonae]|uniref:YoaK family protein n=1 Tax=[Clostridium] hylemonae TaxID=89153 RepID=UPI00110720BA|nr:YoaK family protein [[Clostridium] hylemonae]